MRVGPRPRSRSFAGPLLPRLPFAVLETGGTNWGNVFVTGPMVGAPVCCNNSAAMGLAHPLSSRTIRLPVTVVS